MNLSPLARKALALLQNNHVMVRVATPNKDYGRYWRIPEYAWNIGIFDTQTGTRVNGFGIKTFYELLQAKYLNPDPIRFPSPYNKRIFDRIYYLARPRNRNRKL